jgi:hypothetical protein
MQWKTAGPLALSAAALFGNLSWFDSVFKYSANMTRHDSNYTTKAPKDQDFSWYRRCAGMPFGTLSRSYGWVFQFDAPATCTAVLTSEMLYGSESMTYDLVELRRDWIKLFAPLRTGVSLQRDDTYK